MSSQRNDPCMASAAAATLSGSLILTQPVLSMSSVCYTHAINVNFYLFYVFESSDISHSASAAKLPSIFIIIFAQGARTI